MPGLLADERNLDFPLEKACKLQSCKGESRRTNAMRCSCDAAPWSQAEHFMKLFLGMVSKSKYAETVAPGVFAEEAGPFVRQEEFISNMLRKQFVCYLFLLYLLFLFLISIDALSFTLYSCAFGRCPLEVSCRT